MSGLGRARPARGLAMTIAMLSLAGIPATAGFMGKFRLIEAAVDGDYTWLGVVIVIGSMISLAYYLPVVAMMWRDEAPGAVPAAATSPSPAAPAPALPGARPRPRSTPPAPSSPPPRPAAARPGS